MDDKDKDQCIYAEEHYSASKEENMLYAATGIDSEMITPSKGRQKEKGKYRMVSLTCGT